MSRGVSRQYNPSWNPKGSWIRLAIAQDAHWSCDSQGVLSHKSSSVYRYSLHHGTIPNKVFSIRHEIVSSNSYLFANLHCNSRTCLGYGHRVRENRRSWMRPKYRHEVRGAGQSSLVTEARGRDQRVRDIAIGMNKCTSMSKGAIYSGGENVGRRGGSNRLVGVSESVCTAPRFGGVPVSAGREICSCQN